MRANNDLHWWAEYREASIWRKVMMVLKRNWRP